MKKTIIAILTAAVLTGCGQSGSDDSNVLATFKGGVLTTEDIQAHKRTLQRSGQFKNKPETLTPEFVFEHALNMEMIIAKGLEEKLHRDAAIRNDLHRHMSALFLKMMQDQLVTAIDKESIREEEMRTFYEQHKEQYSKKSQYTLHAFSVAGEQASAAMAAIKDGVMTFAAAASTYGLDEQERKNGGETGIRTLRRFQPAWQPVVKSLKVGEVSGPLEIDGVAYIMLLERKTKPYQYSYDEKKTYIRNDVLYSRYQKQWQKIYDELRDRYEVKINRDNLEAFSAKTSRDNLNRES